MMPVIPRISDLGHPGDSTEQAPEKLLSSRSEASGLPKNLSFLEFWTKTDSSVRSEGRFKVLFLHPVKAFCIIWGHNLAWSEYFMKDKQDLAPHKTG